MGKRRKKRRVVEQETPEPTGILKLYVETPVAKLDLHGMTALQAEARIRDFFRTEAGRSSGGVVHIVTGRGNRSEGAPVLPGVLREMLSDELRHLVKESATLPGGGAVAVRLR